MRRDDLNKQMTEIQEQMDKREEIDALGAMNC